NTSSSGNRDSACASTVTFSPSVARLSTMTRCSPLTLHNPPAPSSPPMFSYVTLMFFFCATPSSSRSVSSIFTFRNLRSPSYRDRLLPDRQRDEERRPHPGLARETDRAAVSFDDVLHDRQPESSPFAILFRREERLEDVGAVDRVDAAAAVGDADLH